MRTAFLAIVLAFTASTAHAKSIPDPVVTVCPKAPVDLDYAIYQMMTDANFQPLNGSISWRRHFDGPFHLPSMEAAQYLHVDFAIFPTSRGTKVIAQPRWRTSTYEFGVQNQAVVDIFQEALGTLVQQFPC